MQKRQTAFIAFLALVIAAGCAKEPVVDQKTSNKKQAARSVEQDNSSRLNGKTGKVTQIPRGGERRGVGERAAPHPPNSSFVSDELFGAVVLHPRRMLSAPLLADFNLAQLIDQAMPDIGMRVEDLEQVVWFLSVPERLKPPPGPPLRSAEAARAANQDVVATEQVEPAVPLDDLFAGLEPAKPVDKEEDAAYDTNPVVPPQQENVAQPGSGFHAFDVYWTPRFLPMILRFVESSKADSFSQRLTKDMSEVLFHELRYYRPPIVSGRPPTIGPDNSPSIRQYLDLGPMSVYLPDAHTVILATEDHIRNMLAASRRRGDQSNADSSPLSSKLDAVPSDIGATAVIDFQRLRQSGTDDSLIEELSERFLASRMALFNLADDVKFASVNVDVAAETLIELEFLPRSDSSSRAGTLKSIGNFVLLLSDSYEKWKSSLAVPGSPEIESLVGLVDQLVQGTSVVDLDTKFVVRTRRPAQFDQLPRVLEALLTRVVREAEEALWRHSLAQIAWAMQVYAAEHLQLPPAASYDTAGKPLLSWRVHLLPYLGHKELYAEFKLDEAWNSAHNITLLDRMPSIYGRESAETHVMVFTGPGTLFEGEQSADESVIAAGQSGSTILLIRTEGDKVAAWTEPKDIDVSQPSVLDALGKDPRDGFLAAFCNGSVRRVSSSEPLDQMIRRKTAEAREETR